MTAYAPSATGLPPDVPPQVMLNVALVPVAVLMVPPSAFLTVAVQAADSERFPEIVAVSITSSPFGEKRAVPPSTPQMRGAALSFGTRSPAATQPSIEGSSMPWTWIAVPTTTAVARLLTTRRRVPAGRSTGGSPTTSGVRVELS